MVVISVSDNFRPITFRLYIWRVQKCNKSFINKLKLDLSHRHFHILGSIVIAILLVPRVSSFITRFGGVGWWHYPFRLSQCSCVCLCRTSREPVWQVLTHTHTCAHVLAVRPLSYYLALCFNTPSISKRLELQPSERDYERTTMGKTL